jgi:phosphatidate phosphatase APP1
MTGSPSSTLLNCARTIERALHSVWRPLTAAVGLRTPRSIAAYRSHGNHEFVWVRGRVLGNKPIESGHADDGLWQHIGLTCRHWLSFEVPFARVKVLFNGVELEVAADGDGYFEARFDRGCQAAQTSWTSAKAWIGNDLEAATVRSQHDVLLVGSDARQLIISDVDDTVIHTGATQLATITRLTFFTPVHKRSTLEGVQELYETMMGEDGANPIFYVSSSAWNLYAMISQVLELGKLPKGPLLLQRLGLANNRFVREPGHRHKLLKIEALLAAYPGLPAVFIGDSGQHDARLYVDAAGRNPGRVSAILIRDVAASGQRSGHEEEIRAALAEAKQIGVPMALCPSGAEMSRAWAANRDS